MYIDKDGLTRSLSAPEIVSAAQVSDSSDQASAGNSPGFAPISPDTPAWGPPSGETPDSPGFAPISPDTPSWGPPSGDNSNSPGFAPISPDTPSWGPPSGDNSNSPGFAPISPDTPSWGPPSGSGCSGCGSVIIVPGQNTGASNQRLANIRFLHAAVNQPAVNISLGDRSVINNMQFGNFTPYYLDSGSQSTLITVTNAQTGQTLYRRYINFAGNTAYTVSIINQGSGISLFTITDSPCNYRNFGCLRAVNLSPNSGPVDIFLSGQGRVFQRVSQLDVTSYRTIGQGSYRALVSEALPCTSNNSIIINSDYVECNNTRIAVMDTTSFNIMNNVTYTLYIIGRAYQFPALQILPLESDLVF